MNTFADFVKPNVLIFKSGRLVQVHLLSEAKRGMNCMLVQHRATQNHVLV